MVGGNVDVTEYGGGSAFHIPGRQGDAHFVVDKIEVQNYLIPNLGGKAGIGDFGGGGVAVHNQVGKAADAAIVAGDKAQLALIAEHELEHGRIGRAAVEAQGADVAGVGHIAGTVIKGNLKGLRINVIEFLHASTVAVALLMPGFQVMVSVFFGKVNVKDTRASYEVFVSYGSPELFEVALEVIKEGIRRCRAKRSHRHNADEHDCAQQDRK